MIKHSTAKNSEVMYMTRHYKLDKVTEQGVIITSKYRSLTVPIKDVYLVKENYSGKKTFTQKQEKNIILDYLKENPEVDYTELSKNFKIKEPQFYALKKSLGLTERKRRKELKDFTPEQQQIIKDCSLIAADAAKKVGIGKDAVWRMRKELGIKYIGRRKMADKYERL